MEKVNIAVNVLNTLEYNAQLDENKNRIYFISHGFNSFNQKHKEIIRNILGDLLLEFYYESDTQYIYYKNENDFNIITDPNLLIFGKYYLVCGIDKGVDNVRRWHVCSMDDLEDGVDYNKNGSFNWYTESGRKILDVYPYCYVLPVCDKNK